MLLHRLAADVYGVQEDIGAERGPHRRRLLSQVAVVRGRQRGEEAVEQPSASSSRRSMRVDSIASRSPSESSNPGVSRQDRDDAIAVGHLARLYGKRGARAGAHLTEVAASQQRLEQRRLPGVGVSDDGKPKG